MTIAMKFGAPLSTNSAFVSPYSTEKNAKLIGGIITGEYIFSTVVKEYHLRIKV